jgi:hypothetical protein
VWHFHVLIIAYRATCDNQITPDYITTKTNLQNIQVLSIFTTFCHNKLQISYTFIYLPSFHLWLVWVKIHNAEELRVYMYYK